MKAKAGLQSLLDVLSAVNFCAVRLALRRRDRVGAYLSHCLRRFDELAGFGLKDKDPIRFLVDERWGAIIPEDRVVLASAVDTAGSTSPAEVLILATVVRIMRPKKVFEIGTFQGATTAVLILNAPSDATVISLDLPPGSEPPGERAGDYLRTDLELVRKRDHASQLHRLGLESRYTQVFCDSMYFDPTPHMGSVELGFIDGAHSMPFIENDTRKMAAMMAEHSIVFWHDYGGKGRGRVLASYLEHLAMRTPIYRIVGTSLAWAPGSSLRTSLK